MSDDTLTLLGGPKTVTATPRAYQRYGEAELEQLREALEQNTLFSPHGKKVKTLCERFAALHGRKHAIPTTSCTASIHTAIAALGLEPGDEIITAPITDMGTVLGMLWCQLIPVFADVDIDTHNLDPKSVEAHITPRTKAIIPVHLAGMPNDMDALRDIADRYNLIIVEDCAQSYFAEYKGSRVGSFGTLACFSINEYKHISCGDGGIVLTDDDELAARCRLFVDKGYDRTGYARVRSTPFLCQNYRMTELQGAVALAQLEKLPEIVSHYRALYATLDAGLAGIDGLCLPKLVPGGMNSAWFYMLRVDEEVLGVTRDWFVQAVNAEGAGGYPYIPAPVYRTGLFANRCTLGDSGLPFTLPGVNVDGYYDEGACPNAERLLRTCINIGIGMTGTVELMEQTAAAYRKVAGYCLREKTHHIHV
jgi:dTDP-4-amino-4,6-dideoxygalactose transaminase